MTKATVTATATSNKTKSTSRAKTKVDPSVTVTATATMEPNTITKITRTTMEVKEVVTVKNRRTKQNHKRWLTYRSGGFSSVVQRLQQSPLAVVGLFVLCIATITVPSWGQNTTLNRAPHFVPGQDMSKFSLSENTPVDSPVYQLRGFDPEGGRLRYSISGPVLSVDPDTGLVRLRQSLDREKQAMIEVIISLTDEPIDGGEPNTISLRREILIRDVNDNQPLFLGRPYSATLSESTPVGSEIRISPPIEVIDRDEGVNAEITFSCFTEPSQGRDETCTFFEITTQKIGNGRYNATVRLVKKLDFEKRAAYVVTVLAKDGATSDPLTASATIAVTVLDIQDQPPIFINGPYSVHLKENTPVDQLVVALKAKDGDRGNPRPIALSIEDDVGGHFKLTDTEVELVGKANIVTSDIPLDREADSLQQTGGIYMFKIRATEMISDNVPGDSSDTIVMIIVEDLDDNPPKFNQDYFNISVPENLVLDTAIPDLLTFVNDPDRDENNKYRLRIEDVENSLGALSVYPEKGEKQTAVTVRVKNPSKFDYDVKDHSKRNFIFDIVALSDAHEPQRTRVYLSLYDVNDNAPTFEMNTYKLEVAENTELNTKISDIKASDLDSNEFGNVTYVLKGFGADFFSTDSLNGGIYVRKNLDFETQRSYTLNLFAKDGGGRQSFAIMIIDLINVNDVHPMFEEKEYSRTIREGATEFIPQLIIRAYDLDGIPHKDRKVTYKIESENSISGHVFSIDENTGEISINEKVNSMDTEKGEYELKVVATDKGKPPLSNSTIVRVRVGTSRNQRPVFKGHFMSDSGEVIPGPPTYKVSIPENATSGYNVTTVQATDPDGMDSMLVYRLIGAGDNFVINERTGLIQISKEAILDRDEKSESYSLTVNAIDAGSPVPEVATAIVQIEITDVNNKPPKFDKYIYTVSVLETTPIDTEVLKLTATDADLNAKISYTILEPIRAHTSLGNDAPDSLFNYRDAFRIDSTTGKIFVNSALDFKKVARVMFSVEARDLNAAVNIDKQVDVTEVIIFIQRFISTNPVFNNIEWTHLNPRLEVEVEEEIALGTTFLKLDAEDPVSQSIITNFELVQPDPDGYIALNDRTGEVSLKKRLDYENLKKTSFNFTVKALTSSGKRFSTADVTVIIKNLNDNTPRFEKNEYRVKLLESSKFADTLLTIKATDDDAIITEEDEKLGFNRISYSLEGVFAHWFIINNETGVIQVSKDAALDREQYPTIELTGVAEDSFRVLTLSAKSTVKILIELLDVNDVAPSFSEKQYIAVIPESADPDTSVIEIKAMDPDEGPGGEIKYEILNEGELSGRFKIDAKSGEIRTARELTGKGRGDPYEIVIRAQDNGEEVPNQRSLFSDTTLLLYVGDVNTNDGQPYFISPTVDQKAQVSENASIGSSVFQVIAKDPDFPDLPSGKLRYQIQSDETDSKFFKIDALNGLITTTKRLDRETQDKYNIILEVSDMGEPPQFASRLLVINVIDVDDHKPYFDRDIDSAPLDMEILEENPSDSVVGELTAIDKDIGPNAAIDYTIVHGNELEFFRINRTEDNKAVLLTTKPLDREQYVSFLLTIKCFKLNHLNNTNVRKPYNAKDLSEIQVLVTVIDIDDHLPKFEIMKNETVGIRHTSPIDTLVATVIATDADSSAAPIQLSIHDVKFVSQFYRKSNITVDLTQIFLLIQYKIGGSGEIRNIHSLIDFVDGYFDLTIRANNSNVTRRHSDYVLKVHVIREKSLLRFVFARPPLEVYGFIPEFSKKVQTELEKSELDISIFETRALMRPDLSYDLSSSTSCFQLSKHGSALTPREMTKIMDSEEMKNLLLETYVAYDVHAVEPCTGNRVQTAMLLSDSSTWLVILAGMVSFASLVALLCTCYLFRKVEPKQKAAILSPRMMQQEIYTTSSQPVLLNSDQIHGPL